MTLPSEELLSLKNARTFFRDLAENKLGKVPKKIRIEAIHRLRHFPADYIIDKLWKDRIENEVK